MSYPILNFFMLVLKVSSDFAPDTIYKGCGLSKAFSQEDFKLVPGQRNRIVTLDSGFILLPVKEDLIF